MVRPLGLISLGLVHGQLVCFIMLSNQVMVLLPEYQREQKVVVQEQEEQDNDDSDSNGLDCMLNLVDSDYDISEDDDDLL